MKMISFAALAALVLGCSGGVPAGDGQNVCTRCTKGAKVSLGAGSTLAPTPCQQSERGEPVDRPTARTLGFGDAIDLLERDVENPLQWKALETSGGDAASGYTPATTARIRTTIAAIEHRVPSLAGCRDSLAVTLDTRLTTADGALDVDGQFHTTLTHDDPAPSGWALLDLAGARGSLMLYPASSGPLAGSVDLGLRFWPDRVRGYLYVAMSKPEEKGSDTYSFLYRPLEARWPADDCEYFDRSLAADETGATPDGRSTAQLVADLQGMLDAAPAGGRWDGPGGQATVVTHLGAPTKVCSEVRPGQRAVVYRMPLQIMTSDGRVRVNGEATGYASFDTSNDTMTNAYLEIYDSTPIPAKEFEAKSGISGVTLGESTAAFWHTEVYFTDASAPGIQGTVVVEGVDLDGHVTGVPWAIQGPIASFNWP